MSQGPEFRTGATRRSPAIHAASVHSERTLAGGAFGLPRCRRRCRFCMPGPDRGTGTGHCSSVWSEQRAFARSAGVRIPSVSPRKCSSWKSARPLTDRCRFDSCLLLQNASMGAPASGAGPRERSKRKGSGASPAGGARASLSSGRGQGSRLLRLRAGAPDDGSAGSRPACRPPGWRRTGAPRPSLRPPVRGRGRGAFRVRHMNTCGAVPPPTRFTQRMIALRRH